MNVRVMAVSAAAAVLVAAALSSMVHGGRDSSATPATGPATASVPASTPGASGSGEQPAVDPSGDGRLTASDGPYGDPFEVPAEAAVDGGDEGGTSTEAAPDSSPAPDSTGVGLSSSMEPTAGDPSGSQGMPSDSGDVQGSDEDSGAGEVPPSDGGEAKQPRSPSAAAPPGPAVSTDPVAVAVLRLVVPGEPPRTAALIAKEVLPSHSDPLLAVLRIDADRRQAVLMLASDVHPEGPAKCAPSAERCRSLTMTAGQVQRLAATSPTGEPVGYRLRLVAVR